MLVLCSIQGYPVRTRTDRDTRRARDKDPSGRDLAMASEAQIISTEDPPAKGRDGRAVFAEERFVATRF
jgi:hypothetical protein